MKNLKNNLVLLTALLLFASCESKEEQNGGGSADITLSQKGAYDFPSETGQDYAPKTPLTVTVTNAGGKATGKLTIAMDGAAADKFTLSTTSITNLDPGKSETFTVVPDMGLDYGDYKATVYVSGKGIAEKTFTVRFVVTELVVDAIRIKSPAQKITYGVGEPLDISGLEVVAVAGAIEIPVELKEEYFTYDFTTAGVKKVTIAVGSAPVQEYEVTVMTLLERIKAAAGTTATIVIYTDEQTEDVVLINVAGTKITLTTPEGETQERTIRKNDVGYLFNVNGDGGDIELTLAGYVKAKGWATPEYGGVDENNNNNPIVLLSKGASLVMKGHSKITGNCMYKNNASSQTGGAISMNASTMVLDEYAQLSNNWIVNAGGGLTYGGGFYAVGSTVTLKGNAKITGNVALSMAGNSYGGAFSGEGSTTVYLEGGEISNNSARSLTGIAGGGAIQIVNATFKVFMSGGVIKDNYVIYKTSGRGSAINVGHAKALVLSGSAAILPGGAIEDTADALKKDSGNAIGLAPLNASVQAININGALSGNFVATVDLQSQGKLNLGLLPQVLRDFNDDNPVDFNGNAPVAHFALRNEVNYTAHTVTPLSDYVIDVNGKVAAK